ncbi:ketopantoate reductase family protein [Aneurinibacillus terranovensis]|uniref:ketopantoate reductase family protein n=1 Tax=Aneurinibacillus terranovensis TaxID=278991 RepID=UPI0004202632|nr:ketopantoate reductase family protein [Aneurinibacillus terranovensis]
MRFLIVGAGAIGGYFGGRLVRKGEDVTFLVRAKKRRELDEKGLRIHSIHGDFAAPVHSISNGEKAGDFDVIIIAVKAYHLAQVLDDIRPFVGESTIILPLLNGYRHFLQLQRVFGKDKILGGLCFIETTLNTEGEIVQSSVRHDLVFGEWDGTKSERVLSILGHMENAGFHVILSEHIQQDIWHKYIFIASMSGITSLMGAPVGSILDNAAGKQVYKKLISEVASIAKKIGAPTVEDIEKRTMETTEALSPSMKSSMQRDVEKKLPVEADHLHGALLELAGEDEDKAEKYPVLSTVYSRLKIYERMLHAK